MFEQSFKNIDNELRKDSGCSTEMDYIEQTSWILFLKYLEDLEINRSEYSLLTGDEYRSIFEDKYKWSSWACPKDSEGNRLFNDELTGDDLKDFVDKELFPYLKNFKQISSDVNTLEYKIGEVFSEIRNKIQSGYVLRKVINFINEMKFQTSEELHELSYLYEEKIMNMGNSGRNGGEYYTPRSLIRTIIKVVSPEVGDKVYDGACGSGGFLVEAYDYLLNKKSNISEVDKYNLLQKDTLYGQEFKPLPYVISIVNMILHGIESPNILRKDTLSENIMTSQGNKYDIILANPPFGAATQDSVLSNFPMRTKETAYLFLQHFIKMLKKNGRAGIVIKNTFLSNSDASKLRKELLENCNLFAILDLPSKVFSAGVKTVVLFFSKGSRTEKIWYYQLNLNRSLGKTSLLTESDLSEFLSLFQDKAISANSWTINIEDIDKESYDLSVKNPNAPTDLESIDSQGLLDELYTLDSEISSLLSKLKDLI